MIKDTGESYYSRFCNLAALKGHPIISKIVNRAILIVSINA